MKGEVRVSGHTTKDISNPSWVFAFATLLREHLGQPVEIVDGRPGCDEWVSLKALEEADIAELYLSGTFGIKLAGAVSGARVSAGLYWRKFDSHKKSHRFVAAAGFPQNNVSLVIEFGPGISFSAEKMLLGLIIAIAELFEVNYLFSVDRKGCDFDHRFDTVSGIGVGLKDIYPINFFGPAFVSLVGMDTLLRLPAEITERHGDSVLVIPFHNFILYDLEQFERARNRIREAIGERFFAAHSDPLEHFMGCILRLPFVMWKESKRFRDERGAAELRPVFDWSDMIGEE